jgi:TldD protein
MTVLLGPGWPGVLLHEAVGHGLEGDFNRKGTSAFSGKVGERVAAPGVTVVDDGTLLGVNGEGRRGSLSIDDEGTPTQENVLIEDGILKGYIHDRLNARLMGVAPTGNGRRESYSHAPMPRMTNTFMRAGSDDPAELLSRVKNGIFAKAFGGGQVDIVSGNFVFSCTEAYKVENGKLGAPIKGATLIGDGPSVLTRVKGIGNDLELDEGVGICGKAGQSLPAGVGQPTLLIEGLTVGGTAA